MELPLAAVLLAILWCFPAWLRLVKPDTKKADRKNDSYNAIFLAVALTEEIRAFFLRIAHVKSPEAGDPECFCLYPWT